MARDKNGNLLEKIWVIAQDNQKELGKIGGHVAVLNKEVGDIRGDINEIKEIYPKEIQEVKNDYVTKIEFSPVKKIVYCATGAILMTVLGAILGLVILKAPIL